MIRRKVAVSTNNSQSQVPNCSEDFFSFWSSIGLGENLFWTKMELRMRLVKAAKASPHAKFYSLKAVNHPANSGGLQ